jgi:hypothetical protein
MGGDMVAWVTTKAVSTEFNPELREKLVQAVGKPSLSRRPRLALSVLA